MKTIGVIGGSGYIGGFLLQALSGLYEVSSLQRSKQAIMPQVAGIKLVQLDQLTETFDIIINTSYNLGKNRPEIIEQNKAVLRSIQKASKPDTHVIHLSSLAVFGFGLDKPIHNHKVELTYDYAYVQSKVHMENLLLAYIPHQQLSIIRLGNVWGPANNSWTQPVAEALQWGLPVAGSTPSYSNLTFIHHIVEYIQFVLQCSTHQTIHHLAEFSAISWQDIIANMSTYLRVEPIPIKQVPFYAKNRIDDLRHVFDSSPAVMVKRMRDGRFSSQYFPSSAILGVLSIVAKLSPRQIVLKQSAYQPDPTFFWILTCQQQFKSITLPGWKPSFTWEDVCVQVNSWLDEAGFTVERSL
jgi:nucleoside-diphosphate-sugar epimerase